MAQPFELNSAVLAQYGNPNVQTVYRDPFGSLARGLERGTDMALAISAEKRARAQEERDADEYKYESERRVIEDRQEDEEHEWRRTEEEWKAWERETAKEDRPLIRKSLELENERLTALLDEAETDARIRKMEEKAILETKAGIEALNDAEKYLGTFKGTTAERNMQVVALANTLGNRMTDEQQLQFLQDNITTPTTPDEVATHRASMVNSIFIDLLERRQSLANSKAAEVFGTADGKKIEAMKITSGGDTPEEGDDVITLYTKGENGELKATGTVNRRQYIAKMKGGIDVLRVEENLFSSKLASDNAEIAAEASRLRSQWEWNNRVDSQAIDASLREPKPGQEQQILNALKLENEELFNSYKKDGLLPAKISTVHQNAISLYTRSRNTITLEEAYRRATQAQVLMDRVKPNLSVANFLLGRDTVAQGEAPEMEQGSAVPPVPAPGDPPAEVLTDAQEGEVVTIYNLEEDRPEKFKVTDGQLVPVK